MSTVHCTFTDVSGASTQGEANLETLSSNERLFRSTKRSAIFLAIAVICILIPMLHFVLVPGFLILSIVTFIRTMKESELVRKAQGECPACHQLAEFKGPISANGSKEICPHCRQLLKIKISRLHAV